MPHTNRHQQRALPIKGGSTMSDTTRAKFNQVRERLIREIEEREGKEEIKYWERRVWLRTP
jgi:hypothetical protein